MTIHHYILWFTRVHICVSSGRHEGRRVLRHQRIIHIASHSLAQFVIEFEESRWLTQGSCYSWGLCLVDFKRVLYLGALGRRWDILLFIHFHPRVFNHTPDPIPMFRTFREHTSEQRAGFSTHCDLLTVIGGELELGGGDAFFQRDRSWGFKRKTSKQHSIENDSQRPHIDLRISFAISFWNDLGRSIAQSADMSDFSLEWVEYSSNSKINNLDYSCFVFLFLYLFLSKHDIFEFQVAMDNSLFMAVIYSLQKLEKEVSGLRLR